MRQRSNDFFGRSGEVLWRGSVFLLLVVLALVGLLIGTAWRRSHPGREAAALTVTFLNVGDGDCTLIQSPDGRAVLVDTRPGGGSLRCRRCAAPARRQNH